VLEALRALAPLTAVRGNNDRGDWAKGLNENEAVEVAGTWLYVLHDRHELDLDPGAAGFAAVIAGHSHRPLIEERRGILFINPGSACPAASPCPSPWPACASVAGR
jgi:putative phosphoesterase